MNRLPSKLLLAALAFFMTALPARADDTFNAAQKAQIEKIVHDYLIANPQVLVEGLDAYQKNQEDAEQKNFLSNVGKYKDFLTSASTPFGGNPHGTHAVVEFFDYNCGYCKKAVDDVIALIKADPQVKVYFKDMPILATTSSDAARYALAAGNQGKYFEFHVALMHSTLQRNKDTYLKIGKDLGLDTAKLQQDAENDQSFPVILQKDLDVARDLGIHGTPGFVIGGKLYPGYMGIDNMKKAVADAYPAGK